MKYAIETNSLVKKYKDFTALNKLNIHVPVGKVYGFLGKNGSGKTTTIRIIMGLIRAEEGEVEIFGTNIKKDRKTAIENVGAIVETPGAYANLTARENLIITADMHGIYKERANEVLKIVGLNNDSKKCVKDFSLGMRQRLGIANALIHNPKIIILDEPMNGLDPQGIREMRKLIKELSQNLGISILISSHLLSEIEQVADYIGIINNGTLIKETNILNLKFNEQSYVLLETDKYVETIKLLDNMKLKYKPQNQSIKVFCSKDRNEIINYELVKQGIAVKNLASTLKTLEENFLELINEQNGGI